VPLIYPSFWEIGLYITAFALSCKRLESDASSAKALKLIGFAVGPKHPWKLPIDLTIELRRRASEVFVETDRNENRYSAIASPNPVLAGAQNSVGGIWASGTERAM
jgi:hypothetical protein